MLPGLFEIGIYFIHIVKTALRNGPFSLEQITKKGRDYGKKMVDDRQIIRYP